MNSDQILLTTFMQATEALLRNCFAQTKAIDPLAYSQGCAWFDTPGSRVELRVNLGGRIAAQTHTVSCVVVDEGGEALWEMFTLTAPADTNPAAAPVD